jgi:hypothetical protein
MPLAAAIPVTVFLASAAHGNFWRAVPLQLVFCGLYVGMGNSLAASITAHIAANVLVYLPLRNFFQKWHIHTLFLV